MSRYSNIKQDKEEVIKARLDWLRRSRNIGNFIGTNTVTLEDKLTELKVDARHLLEGEVYTMLMDAVLSDEKYKAVPPILRCCRFTNDLCVSCKERCKSLRSEGNDHRRGAMCELNPLERDGLVTLLKKYLSLKRLHSCSLL